MDQALALQTSVTKCGIKKKPALLIASPCIHTFCPVSTYENHPHHYERTSDRTTIMKMGTGDRNGRANPRNPPEPDHRTTKFPHDPESILSRR